MSDYMTWVTREVLHADGWGWRVKRADPGISVEAMVDGVDNEDAPVLVMDADGARALAAALLAAANEEDGHD